MFDRKGNLTARQPKKVNWPLIVGGSLVALVLFLAVVGPFLAPKDPREQKLIIQVDGEWLIPPYSAFTPGYPLGSDNLGRDLYSWLLHSIWPTMTLVLLVALFRLTLGVLVGVGAGWSDGLMARFFDSLISAALAVPALIAALIVITAVGFRLGIWAFVVGLGVTGWAETAQLVREQTRTVKGQESVEASRALGASGAQTFLLHVLPHIMPMVWMLLAFEISNTLVTTAGLGFLGYYLGGAVFTEVDDFVYQRISEMPELGQMLATAWMVLDEPWAMVAAGTVVFLIVLAFNLVGEGLQQRLTRRLGGPRAIYTALAGGLLPWFEERVGAPVSRLAQRPAFRTATALLLVICVGGGVAWWRAQNPPATPTAVAPTATVAAGTSDSADATATPEPAPVAALSVPGGHIYASEGRDPWHTRWVDFSGPMTTTARWEFEHDDGFTGGPVIDAAGTLYIPARVEAEDGTESGVVYALSAEGDVLWETPVLSEPVGTPALAPDGTLYVAEKAGVQAISPAGAPLWRFVPETGDVAVAGPVVAPDGAVYYKSFGSLLALEPTGSLRWRTTLTESATALAPHLSPEGDLVLWQQFALRTEDGAPHDWGELLTLPEGLSQIVVGAEGAMYHRYGVSLLRLVPPETALQEALVFDWNFETWEGDAAGLTPAGRPWLAARPPTGGMGLGFYWGEVSGTLKSKLGVLGLRNVRVVGIDVDDVAYLCGGSYQSRSGCVAFAPESNRALWRLDFRGVQSIAGAALAPGRLYVATRDGTLTAIGAAAATLPGGAGAAADDAADTPTPPPVDPGPAWASPVVPGDPLWASAGRDPWGTHWMPARGPRAAEVGWAFEAEGGITGSPAVAADGTIYAGTGGGQLVALDPEGEVRWRVKLNGGAVGGPALGSDGAIYVTDWGGYLSAFTPAGELLWSYHPTGVVERPIGSTGETQPLPMDAMAPATTGPIVAPDGTIYYGLAVETNVMQDALHLRWEVMVAASPAGEDALEDPPFVWSEWHTPWLLPGERFVVFNRNAHALEAPQLPEGYVTHWQEVWEAYQRNTEIYLFSGADGRMYLGYRRTLETIFLTPTGFGVIDVVDLEEERALGSIQRAGATPEGLRWAFFSSGKFVWIDAAGQMTGPVRFPLDSAMVAIDGEDAVYGCGSSMGKAPECMAYAYGATDPLWRITLAEGETFAGGAVVPGAMYVATDAQLYALVEP